MAARGSAADGAEGVLGPLDPAAVRALPVDAFAALLLRLGRYRVDPAQSGDRVYDRVLLS
jgi:hypothetical protein